MEHLEMIVFATAYLYTLIRGLTLAVVFVTAPVWVPLYVYHQINRGRHHAR
jgi:hypothetical protein